MAKRDEFSPATKRALPERAGQQCCNPGCGRRTSGAADEAAGKSTRLGKAAHITAAAEGGPRYDSDLSPEQRSSAENGIWMCAECADRVDKPENEKAFPNELLRHWKNIGESTAGTDFATKDGRKAYPVRRLTLVDFAGVKGTASIEFGALTVILGTSKLNRSIGKILEIFGERSKFEGTRQSKSGDTTHYGGLTVKFSKPRYFPSHGKLCLELSDARKVTVVTADDSVQIFVDDVVLPVFSPFLHVVRIDEGFRTTIFDADPPDHLPGSLNGLARLFNITASELNAALQGLPSETSSLFDYAYTAGDEGLDVRIDSSGYHPLGALSGGELIRVVLDVAVRVATHSGKVRPTVLAVTQEWLYTMDARGWATLLEWVEKERRPFQVVVDLWSAPKAGELSHALCYRTIGGDMAVDAFEITTWNDFRQKAE